MNRNEVTAIAVRILAIVIFLYCLKELLPAIFTYLDKLETIKDTHSLRFYAGIAAVAGLSIGTLVIAPLLWFFPYTTASIILPKERVTSQEYKWNNENVLSCGLVILGVYFLYYVIVDVVYWVYIMNYPVTTTYGSVTEYTPKNLSPNDRALIVATVVELFLSVFLIFGANGISRLILKIRGRGAF